MMPLAVGAVQPGAVKQNMAEGAVATRPTKLFIGGITRNTTTKQLRDHFSAYGRVLDCVAMRQPDGRPRGFGYVTLDSPQAADLCLAAPQVIDGRVVDMKRAVPEGDMDSAPTTRLHTPGATRLPPGLVTGPGPAARGAPGLTAGVVKPVPAPRLALSAMMDLCNPIPETPATLSWDHAESVPDCLALLSTRPEDLCLPDTPRAPNSFLSASAPEFVPGPVLGEMPKVQNQGAPVRQRSALGEITNTLVLRNETKMKVPMSIQIDNGVVPALKTSDDQIYEDSSEATTPPESPQTTDPELDQVRLLDPSLSALPSRGSIDHAFGTCKRCNFYPKGRCQNGRNCTFCHLPHERRKAGRAEKRERQALEANEELALPMEYLAPLPVQAMQPGRLPAPAPAALLPPLTTPPLTACFSASPLLPPGLTPSILATQPAEEKEIPLYPALPQTLAGPSCLSTAPMVPPSVAAPLPPSSPMTVLLQPPRGEMPGEGDGHQGSSRFHQPAPVGDVYLREKLLQCRHQAAEARTRSARQLPFTVAEAELR